MSSRPCLVDCAALCKLLEDDGRSEPGTAPPVDTAGDDSISAWGDDGRSAAGSRAPVFDEHFRASKRYQRLVRDVCAVRISKGRGNMLVDVDVALDAIMRAWYQWRYAPEDIDVGTEA